MTHKGFTVTRSFALHGLVFLSLLLPALAGAQSKDDQRLAQSLYRQAMATNDAAKRLRLLQQAVTLRPAAADLQYALGREFYQRAQLDSATAHFERVMALDARLAKRAGLRSILAHAYSALATARLEQGKLESALESALAATRHDPDFIPALSIAAVLNYQMGRYDKAIDLGAHIVQLQPTAKHYNNLGAAYEANGNLSAAVENYRRALARDPNVEEAQNNLRRIQAILADTAGSARASISALASVKPSRRQLSKSNQPGKAGRRSSRSRHSVTRRNRITPVARHRRRGNPGRKEYPLARIDIGPPRHRESLVALAPVLDQPQTGTGTGKPDWLRLVHSHQTLVWSALGFLALTVVLLSYYRRRSQHSRSEELAAEAVAESTPAEMPESSLSNAGTQEEARPSSPRDSPEALAEKTPSTPVEMRGAEPVGEATPPAPQEVRSSAEPLPPEDETARAAESAPAQSDDEDGKPGEYLQTEVLFADMIAASPEVLNGEAGKEEKQPAAPEDEQQAGQSSQPERDLAVETESHAGDESQMDAATTETESPQAQYPVVEQPAAETTPSTAPGEQPPAAESGARRRINRYIIEKEIANGTTGKIYKARDPKLDRTVVLKTVEYGLGASEHEIAVIRDRIYREARAAAKLNHPNIVVVYDVDDEPAFSYIVMEYLDGKDLRQVLEREHRLDYLRAIDIVVQVCNAVEYAHQAGVYHRDIKPSNIMMLDHDEAKVMDFGIAKINNYLTLTQTGRVLGTPSYMAPEQIEGHSADGRADLFSLGVVLYELLVGKRPFVADSLASLAYKIVHKTPFPPSLENVEIPIEFDEILNRALAKRPAARYHSAAEFRDVLLEVKRNLEGVALGPEILKATP